MTTGTPTATIGHATTGTTERAARATRTPSAGGGGNDGTRMNDDYRSVIAIDGPAAAGKTTVARALADRVGAMFLDTGLLYRAVTLQAQRDGIDPTDGERLAALARGLDLTIRPATVPDGRPADILIDGEDVTPDLRTAAVDATVSEVSAHAAVRASLLPVQRRLASAGPIVMVGRDIATVVVPDAGVKIYLDASLGERARRRFGEIRLRGDSVTYAQVLDDLRRRDEVDTSRAVAPLRRDDDAVVVDTDGLSVPRVVDRLAEIVRTAWDGAASAPSG